MCRTRGKLAASWRTDWPAIYLIDKRGVVRHLRVGEGGYEQTEGRIQALLKEPSDS